MQVSGRSLQVLGLSNSTDHVTGLFLCVLTLGAYFLRLLHNQTPSPSKIGAQLIPVAALANAAYSFSSLGYVVGIKKHLFEDYPGGSGSLGDPIVGECIVIR